MPTRAGQRLQRIWRRLHQEMTRSGPSGVAHLILSYVLWRARGRPMGGSAPTLTDWHRTFGWLRPRPLPAGRYQISVVCPIYNTEAKLLEACIGSVLNQTYSNWELVLVDDCSDRTSTTGVLDRHADDANVRIVRTPNNLGVVGATNFGLEQAAGEYVAFLDHDDVLASTCLEWVAAAAEGGGDLIYTDEDKLQADGALTEPFFKPSWSPRLLLSLNYVNHFTCVRTSLAKQVGGLREDFGGAQDHDLLLRLSEVPMTVAHLPNLLYHWRATADSTAGNAASKPEAEEAGLRAVEEALQRRGLRAEARLGRGDPFRYRPHFSPPAEPPTVKVVIPTRDRLKLLRRTLKTVAERTSGADLHVVVVDNGSEEGRTIDFLRHLQRANQRRVTVHRVDEAFNFSRLCNQGAAAGPETDFVLLLNNDVEVLHRSWLTQLLGWFQDPEVVGAGPKLLFPDLTIQHAGVVLGMGGIAGHYGARLKDEPVAGRLHDQAREIGCLTAACLLVRTADYWKVGGLDESLPLDFQDVDFCLRLRTDLDGVLIYDPTFPLIHYESASRGTAGASNRYTISRLRFRWSEALSEGGDPYYNPHLTLWAHDSSMAGLPGDQQDRLARLEPVLIANRGWPTVSGSAEVAQNDLDGET